MRTAISSQIIVWITNLEFVKRGRLSLFNLIKMVCIYVVYPQDPFQPSHVPYDNRNGDFIDGYISLFAH